jgi:phosphoribosylglycinamide formyltransferase-1
MPIAREPVSIAVFASGRGTNFQAIADAIDAGTLSARISVLLSDRVEARAVELARSRGLRAVTVPPVPGLGREHHEERVLAALAEGPDQPRFIVLAGYMRILSAAFLERFRSEKGYARVVNIHPSLLPAFPGRDSYARAFEHGSQLTGVTVHLVEPEVDAGPILAQEAFSIADCRSTGEVERRGLAIENRLYPRTLSWVLPETFAVERNADRRLCVRAN